MPVRLPSQYDVKKALLWPRTAVMRRKFRDIQPTLKAMLELHSYSPAILQFLDATIMNGHILHEADIDAGSVVLDVGAFTGQWTQHIVDRYDPTVYAFEPNPRSFVQLQQKAADNPKLRPLAYGVGDREMLVDFTLKGLGSSMCDDRAEHGDLPRVQVRIAAIDQIWRELQLGDVDLMKINIEGAEFPLLAKMRETVLLPRVRCFMIQFHEWHPGARRQRRELQRALMQTHRLEWNYDFVWEKWVRK